jgi:hypothetical protein
VPRRPGSKRSPSSAGVLALSGLHFIFDAFGATRPIRLGLAIALSFALRLLVPTASQYGLPSLDERTLAFALFGVSFCLLFWPLLVWPGLPEPLKEWIVILDTFSKKSGLSQKARRELYFDFLQIVISSNKELAAIDFSKVKESFAKSHSAVIPSE